MLVVVEELVDHDSSSGAKRAAGCTTSSGKGINVELDVVVLVVVRLARRLPSCLPRSAKTPASFTEPANNDVVMALASLTWPPLKKVIMISFFVSFPSRFL